MSLEERISILEDLLAKTVAELAASRQREEEREAENKALRKENEALRKDLDKWKRGFRERSKRRSSRQEGKRKAKGKSPGREAGHQGAQRTVPERIDGTEVHPPPALCACGGAVALTGEEDSTIVQDIPHVPQVQNIRHVAPEGQCKACGKKHRARLPGRPAQGGGALVAVSLGPNLLALTLDLRFERHVPLAGLCGFMGTWFGIDLTASGAYQLAQRWKARSEVSYREVVSFTRASDLVGLDETPIRQDGLGAWAWLARTETSSLYRIELSRAGWVFEAMMGEDYAGRVVSDFYSVYTSRDGFTHAYCGAHTQREAKKIAELGPSPATEGFRDKLDDWYLRAKEAQKSGDESKRRGVKISLGKLIANERLAEDPDVARLQARLVDHFDGVVAFVDNPAIPADNSASERDIRNLAAFRKVSGGTRSPEGSEVLAHWKTVGQTRKKNDLPMRPWVVELYERYWEGLPPPSVFAEV
jgi:transposase